jgi:predicted nucleic-acid-binding Zn-ribbon protein
MKLTEAQHQRVGAALRERLRPDYSCPSCGQNDFEVPADGVIFVPASEGLDPDLPYVTLPSIAMICIRCGNTQLYNMHRLGLLDLLDPAGPVPPPA